MIIKRTCISIVLVVAFILWSYVVYDSARQYVHAGLADQLIELRTSEHAVVSKAIEDLDRQDNEKLRKRLQILSEIYTEDLHNLERNIYTENGMIGSLVISRENMELLRQFVASNSISIEYSRGDESH